MKGGAKIIDDEVQNSYHRTKIQTIFDEVRNQKTTWLVANEKMRSEIKNLPSSTVNRGVHLLANSPSCSIRRLSRTERHSFRRKKFRRQISLILIHDGQKNRRILVI